MTVYLIFNVLIKTKKIIKVMGPSTVQFWVLISLLKWQASNLNKIIFSTTNLGQRLFFFLITVVLCLMTENKYAAFSFISIYFFLTSFVFFFYICMKWKPRETKSCFLFLSLSFMAASTRVCFLFCWPWHRYPSVSTESLTSSSGITLCKETFMSEAI